MSEHVYDEAGINRKVQRDQNNQENIEHVYVSAESLKVYENPWVEGSTPNIPTPAEAQCPVFMVKEKKKRVGTSVILGVVCLLLLVTVIVLGVESGIVKKDKIQCEVERVDLRPYCKARPGKCKKLFEEIEKLGLG